MVGESAGIRISTGMGPLPGCLSAVLCEVGGLRDDRLDLAVDLLESVGIDHAQLQYPRLHALDRVLLLAHLLDLLLGAVFRRVGHRVAAVAVGQHLEDVGALAAARMGNRLAARLLDRENVHAVDLHAGNAVGLAALVEVGPGRRPLDAGAHAVLVVLDDVDHRQLPQRGHVEGLVDLALVDRAVAQIGQGHAVLVAVFLAEGDTGAERHLGADDAVAAEEAPLAAEHVHGAPLALGVAAGPARQLRHHAARLHAAGQHMPMIAVRGDHRVLRRDHRLHADDDRFLTDIKVAEATDQAHAVHLPGLFLETPDQQHVAVVRAELFR
jgi:hypothetical protein